MLPNEVDNTSMSSANDTFADCQDGNTDVRDPLATTFADQPTLNTTTEGDCYESAIQDEFKEAITDITMDAGQLNVDQTEITAQDIPQPLDYEDEPMDVDMNATVDMIQNSANNIQNVEKVLQHAENILQHLGEKTLPPSDNRDEIEDVKIIGSLAKPTESSKMTFVINAAANVTVNVEPTYHQHLEMEKSNHDVSLNKSIELPMNRSKTVSSECVITAVNNDVSLKEEKQMENLNITKESAAPVTDVRNLTVNTMNSSTSSNASCKSPNLKLNMTASMTSSTGSLKSSAPTSPSFPIKQSLQGSSFPKSPKSQMNSNKPTFLEKSDYAANLERKFGSQENVNTFNGTFAEPHPINRKNRLTFGVESANIPVISDTDDCVKSTDNKRLTFNVQTENPSEQSGMSFPTKDKSDNTRRTFCINDVSEMPTQPEAVPKEKIDTRRTFNIPSEELQPTPMDTSLAPMDIDDNQISQNTTMPMTETVEGTEVTQSQISVGKERSQSPALPLHRSQSPALANLKQRSQSPALAQSNPCEIPHPTCQSPALSYTADSHPLPAVNNRSNSPPLPTMQKRSVSPPLPIMQQRTQSPSLSSMQQQESQITEFKKEQSPPLPTIQKRPPIHGFGADVLSAKEQTNIKIKDEKDVYVEKSTPSPMEEMFTAVSATSTTLTNISDFSGFDHSSSLTSSAVSNNTAEQQFGDDEFQSNSNREYKTLSCLLYIYFKLSIHINNTVGIL